MFLCGKKDFSDVIKLRILRGGGYHGLSRWAQCDHKGHCKWRGRQKRVRKRFEDLLVPTLKMRGGRDLSQGIKVAPRSWKGKENKFSTRVSTKEQHPANILALAHCEPFRISDLPNCKIVNMCCLKPLS